MIAVPVVTVMVRKDNVSVPAQCEVLLTNKIQFYHYFLTFDDEVSQIWPQPWRKMGKILFLAIRYSGIIYNSHILVGKKPHPSQGLSLDQRTECSFE